MSFINALLDWIFDWFSPPVSTIATATVKALKPRAERNNNPGNLRASKTPYLGQIAMDEGGYLVFESAEYGLRAAMVTLRTYFNVHNLRTIRGIVTRWAPAFDRNPTAAYISFVCTRLQTTADVQLNFDRHVIPLLRAMVYFEAGKDPYTEAQYKAAKAML